MFFYLTHYPRVYAKVAEEIRKAFTSYEDIRSGTHLMSCTYLRSCLREAMRISPPSGGAIWREVEEGGVRIDCEYIPAGFDVGTSMYAIHHNEAYYPDPYDYLPERWILSSEGPPLSSVELAQSAWNPFLLGPRGCVGRGLAWMELAVTMAWVIWRFDFRMTKGSLGRIGEGKEGASGERHRVNEFQMLDHLTGVKDGPMIEFRERVI
ncbi:hypothetical protein MMC30_008032 [Trapelia coarctata]|nr:hypothetical protein [Trapelia coarctata]